MGERGRDFDMYDLNISGPREGDNHVRYVAVDSWRRSVTFSGDQRGATAMNRAEMSGEAKVDESYRSASIPRNAASQLLY